MITPESNMPSLGGHGTLEQMSLGDALSAQRSIRTEQRKRTAHQVLSEIAGYPFPRTPMSQLRDNCDTSASPSEVDMQLAYLRSRYAAEVREWLKAAGRTTIVRALGAVGLPHVRSDIPSNSAVQPRIRLHDFLLAPLAIEKAWAEVLEGQSAQELHPTPPPEPDSSHFGLEPVWPPDINVDLPTFNTQPWHQ